MASERQDHSEISPWWGEHMHRYQEALNFIGSKDNVLDLACGNGFGSNLIASNTSGEVIGGDISEESIAYCELTFKNNNRLKFERIDGTNIPYEDSYFETIISFETIEHTVEYKKMISEFRRVLTAEGCLILSTPNFLVNSPTGKVTNPFHTQEFTYEQLHTLLSEYFTNVRILGQEYVRYKTHGLRYFIAKIIEKFFYLRGIRKTPITLKNFIMNTLIKNDFYPSASDYYMTSNKEDLLNCKTFFAICYK